MPSSGCKKCARSEEHTSELQSHDNLVCRLLLEKTTASRTCPRLSWRPAAGTRRASPAPGPASVVAHGSVSGQSVPRYLSSPRTYIFFKLLASRGYVVLDPAYRASD